MQKDKAYFCYFLYFFKYGAIKATFLATLNNTLIIMQNSVALKNAIKATDDFLTGGVKNLFSKF